MKSPHSSRSLTCALWLCVAAAALLGGAGSGVAQEAEPEEAPWPLEVVATMRSFFERVDIEAVYEDLTRPPAPGSAAIPAGWEGPFHWVRQTVAFDPYFGSLRGAEGTRAAMAGNSLDQALLLQSLYEQRGTRARLVRGRLKWDDAARLVGPTEESIERGTLGLRLVELTADHWWVEAERAGDWIALDPVFSDAAPGGVRGRDGRVHDRVPGSLQAVVELSARVGERQLLRINRTVDALGAGVVRFAVLPEDPEGPGETEATDAGDPGPAGDASGSPDSETEAEGTEGGQQEAEPVEEPDPIAESLPTFPPGPLQVAVTAGALELGRFTVSPSELEQLEVRARVAPPLGSPTSVAVPWLGGPETTITVFIGAGQSAEGELRRVSRQLYGLLRTLTTAELDGRAAYETRPERDPDAPRLAPPLPAPMAAEVPAAEEDDDEEGDEEEELDPWTELHLEAIDAWLQFERLGVEGIARSLLAAVDRLTPPGRVWRSGVRLLAVRWAPPLPESDGRVAVWADDPIVLRGRDSERLQAAHDLLYSALLGQVLNRVADRPPVSAFDVTLRSVGTGSRLSWWRDGAALPDAWPRAAREEAGRDLAGGNLIAGPLEPIAVSDPPLLGWWSYAPRTGLISGRVVSEPGVAQAEVPFGEPRDLRDMESTLASLATLHEALRFLVRAGDPDTAAIAELIPRACAATSLVRDLMLAGAPDGWRDPAFEAFCLGR